MKWIDALIDFNETKKNWVVPRKGTKAYISSDCRTPAHSPTPTPFPLA